MISGIQIISIFSNIRSSWFNNPLKPQIQSRFVKRTSLLGGASLIIGSIPLIFFLFFGLCVTYPKYPYTFWSVHLIVPMFFILTLPSIIGLAIGYRDRKNNKTENFSSWVGIASSYFSLIFLLPYYSIMICYWFVANLLFSFLFIA
jgi:hypothetical protein